MHSEVTVAAREGQRAARTAKRSVTALTDAVVPTTALCHLTAAEAVAPGLFPNAGGSLRKGGISIK